MIEPWNGGIMQILNQINALGINFEIVLNY